MKKKIKILNNNLKKKEEIIFESELNRKEINMDKQK